MIEGVRVLKLGPCSARMHLYECTYSAVKAVVREDAAVGTILRLRDYPVNLCVRRLTRFLSCRKRSLNEANKIYIGSTQILAIPFTLASFNPRGRVWDKRILG